METIDFDSAASIDEKGEYYYVPVRFSRSKQAAELGAVWCVYERKWRIKKNHPNLAALIAISGYKHNDKD